LIKSDVSTYANFKKIIKAHYAGQLNANLNANLTPVHFQEGTVLDTEETEDINSPMGKRSRFPTNKLQIDGRKKSYEYFFFFQLNKAGGCQRCTP
jgi:hypothetical protein